MYIVYDRVFGDFPAPNAVYTPYICMALANLMYMFNTFGMFDHVVVDLNEEYQTCLSVE
jgi:hypothetical protein